MLIFFHILVLHIMCE